jgi:hypothetical protein
LYCGLRFTKGSPRHAGCQRRGTDAADIFKKTPKANAGFETASLKGLMAITEGIWADTKDNHHAKVTPHEYFHVYQLMMKYYFEKEDKIGVPRRTTGLEGGPAWIIEGGAEYFAYNVMGKYKWKEKSAKKSYEYWMRRPLTAAKLEISRCKKKGIKIVLKITPPTLRFRRWTTNVPTFNTKVVLGQWRICDTSRVQTKAYLTY